MKWRRVASVGLPWQGGTVPIGKGPGCTTVDPFTLTAASADVLLLTDDLCATKTPGTWRSQDAGRTWAGVQLPSPSGGWRPNETWLYPGSAEPPTNGADVISARFFPGGTGVIAVTTRPGQLLVYLSHDLGASWRLASMLQIAPLGLCRFLAVRVGATGPRRALHHTRRRPAMAFTDLGAQPADDGGCQLFLAGCGDLGQRQYKC
jgi:hypothetical protein